VAIIIPPGFAQAVVPFQHALLARTAYVVFGVDVSGLGGDYEAGADAVTRSITIPFQDELDSEVVVGPTVLRVGQDGGDPLSVSGSYSDNGAEAAQMLPPNVALLVKKNTALGGRRGRGRMYMPWVTQDGASNDVGTLDGASLAARQTAADEMLASLASEPVTAIETPMVLLHDSSGAGVEPPPTPVTSLLVDSRVATQRRRMAR
jgi:hypothetical protein